MSTPWRLEYAVFLNCDTPKAFHIIFCLYYEGMNQLYRLFKIVKIPVFKTHGSEDLFAQALHELRLHTCKEGLRIIDSFSYFSQQDSFCVARSCQLEIVLRPMIADIKMFCSCRKIVQQNTEFFRFAATLLWNSFPENFRQESSINQFKDFISN